MKNLFVVLFVCCFVINACKEKADSNSNDAAAAVASIPNISYSVVKTYPHDTSSFTQGLVVYKGQMYEGTGGDLDTPDFYKPSQLMHIDIATGKAQKALNLNEHDFGEGITILNDTIYQLTWTERKVHVYTLPDFKKVKEFPINTDGWGITNDGSKLIVSDGTANLYFYDPSTFRLLHTQSISFNGETLFNINELEYIDGFIYANQWQTPYIYKINPDGGQVTGRIDISDLWKQATNNHPDYVPNGIAYDAGSKKLYLTGKKWPTLYEVQLSK